VKNLPGGISGLSLIDGRCDPGSNGGVPVIPRRPLSLPPQGGVPPKAGRGDSPATSPAGGGNAVHGGDLEPEMHLT